MPQKCSSLKNCVKLKMSTCCSRHLFDFSPIDDCAVELSALHLSELKPCVTSILKQRFTANDVFRLNMSDIFSFMVIDSPFEAAVRLSKDFHWLPYSFPQFGSVFFVLRKKAFVSCSSRMNPIIALYQKILQHYFFVKIIFKIEKKDNNFVR